MILRITTKPNAAKNEIAFDADGKMVVKITAAPVDGNANKHLEKFLSSVFDVPVSRVKIIKGFANPHKTIEVIADDSVVTMILQKLKSKE